MACWNIEGLYKYKFDFEILNYIKKYDICGFCETLGVCEKQFQNFLDNYVSLSCISKKKQQQKTKNKNKTKQNKKKKNNKKKKKKKKKKKNNKKQKKKKQRNVGRFSGGVTVFVRRELIELRIISRIFDNCNDSVNLLLNEEYFRLENDVILLFVYLSPEGLTVYENFEGKTNGVDLFEEEILSTIVASYPDVSCRRFQ